MASSNHLTRKAKELRDTEGVPLSEAKRRLSATGSSYPWELLGITDIATYDPTPCWSQPVSMLQLQVCAGADTAGTPIVVDLVDQRLGGQGPHWLIQARPENDGASCSPQPPQTWPSDTALTASSSPSWTPPDLRYSHMCALLRPPISRRNLPSGSPGCTRPAPAAQRS